MQNCSAKKIFQKGKTHAQSTGYIVASDNRMHCGGEVVIGLLVRYLYIVICSVHEVYKASMFNSSLLAKVFEIDRTQTLSKCMVTYNIHRPYK